MRFRQRWIEFWLVPIVLVAGVTPLCAAEPTHTDTHDRPMFEAGKVVVKLRPDAAPLATKAMSHGFGIASLDAISEELGVWQVAPMFRARLRKARPDLPDLSRIYLVELPEEVDVRRAALLFGRSPLVEYAEALPVYDLAATPDDPEFHRQRFLSRIMAEAAWDVHKGEDGAEVVAGMAESGVDWRHKDLAENIYQNLGEDLDGDGHVIERLGYSWIFDPGDVNGIDDDGNGYPDDFVGWNFCNDDGGEDNDPNDPSGHGTYTAGLVAARTNNATGIASISWNVKILPTSFTSSRGRCTNAVFKSFVYLADNGADIIYTGMLGSGTGSRGRLMREVAEYVRGLGVVMFAPVGGMSISSPVFPSALPGFVSVAGLSGAGRLTATSNFGISVDIAAPGTNLLSTSPSGEYETRSGSGNCPATAVVAGVFALVKSLHPDWSNERLIQQVLMTADSIDDLNPGFEGQLGHGRVNAFRALTEELTPPPELRLEVQDVRFADDTGDGTVEDGERTQVSLTLRNYSHMPGSQALTLTLSADSPFIDVVDSTVVVGVKPDSVEDLTSAFSIRVDRGAPSGFYDLTLTAEAYDADISPLSILDMRPLLVANGGLLVWEGFQRSSFSGRYLRNELQARGFEVTYGFGEFPGGMTGFDGVFLSFGGYGAPLWEDIPRLDADWKVESIGRYLESGGKLYLEGADTLGDDIFNLVDGSVLLPLFGLESAVDGDYSNPIDRLDGHAGALTAGMRFTETRQSPVGYIDIFTPADGAAAFTESDYGIVAVQNDGAFGQRTFCFSYALADLLDGSTTRADLLDAIVGFLGLSPGGETSPRARRAGRRVGPEREGTPR
jgi:subtilisin family serine protease